MKFIQPINKDTTNIVPEKTKHTNKTSSYKNKFQILSEALPYVEMYNGQNIVIVVDDRIIEQPNLLNSFASDIVLIKKAGINPVLVHSADHGLRKYLKKMNVPFDLHNNKVMVNNRNIEFVEMICSAYINKAIVTAINSAGGTAIGVSGKDGKMIEAIRSKVMSVSETNIDKILDNSHSGEPVLINPSLFAALEDSEIIPVIAPIGHSDDCKGIYLDAMTIAGFLSTSIAATKLVIMSDKNIFTDENNEPIKKIELTKAIEYANQHHPQLASRINVMISTTNQFSEAVHFLDMNIEHALVFELLSDDRPGTTVYSNE